MNYDHFFLNFSFFEFFADCFEYDSYFIKFSFSKMIEKYVKMIEIYCEKFICLLFRNDLSNLKRTFFFIIRNDHNFEWKNVIFRYCYFDLSLNVFCRYMFFVVICHFDLSLRDVYCYLYWSLYKKFIISLFIFFCVYFCLILFSAILMQWHFFNKIRQNEFVSTC